MNERHPRLIIVDDRFPSFRSGGFGGRRYTENTYLLEHIACAEAICPSLTITKRRTAAEFADEKATYLTHHPNISPERIKYGEEITDFTADLGYCVFLTLGHRLLRHFEAARTPFALTIYPGGGLLMWGPRKQGSDRRLADLFASPMMKMVFVHHRIIRDYLLAQKFVDPDRITFIKGGFVQLHKHEVRTRSLYGVDRTAFNICFVANKYDEIGAGKGYDVFIETAHLLHKTFDHIRFHVVGEWDSSILDVSALGDAITFHGYRPRHFFPEFYARMDAIISPTRLDVPQEGKFDGFPLVTEAGYCGVAMFVTDPLRQNEDFVPGQDIEIVTADASDIAARLSYYISHPAALRRLGENGQRILHVIRDMDRTLSEKASVLRKLLQSAGGSAP